MRAAGRSRQPPALLGDDHTAGQVSPDPPLIWSIGELRRRPPTISGSDITSYRRQSGFLYLRRSGCLEPQVVACLCQSSMRTELVLGCAGNGDRHAWPGRRHPSSATKAPVYFAGIRHVQGSRCGGRRMDRPATPTTIDVRELLRDPRIPLVAERRRFAGRRPRAKIVCFNFSNAGTNARCDCILPPATARPSPTNRRGCPTTGSVNQPSSPALHENGATLTQLAVAANLRERGAPSPYYRILWARPWIHRSYAAGKSHVRCHLQTLAGLRANSEAVCDRFRQGARTLLGPRR